LMPLGLCAKPLARRNLRPVTESLARFRRISVGVALVSDDVWRVPNRWDQIKGFAEESDGLIHRQGLAPADVVDLPGLSALDGRNRAGHCISYERVAPRLFAVAKHRDRPAVEERLGKDVIGHIWSLARPVHREVAE